jgi:hypothetical protein
MFEAWPNHVRTAILLAFPVTVGRPGVPTDRGSRSVQAQETSQAEDLGMNCGRWMFAVAQVAAAGSLGGLGARDAPASWHVVKLPL